MVLLVGAAAGFVLTRQEGDVSNPDVEFKAEPSATPETELEPEDPNAKRPTRAVDRFIWAHYGYTRDRRRYLALDRPPRPPFEEIWRFSGNVLLEFPPVIGGRRLYLLNDHGRLFAIDKHTGKVRWRRKLGRARSRFARLRGRHRLRRPAAAHAEGSGLARRPGRRARRQQRQDQVEPQARQPQRVLPARGRRPRVLRGGERERVRDGRPQRRGALAHPGRAAPSRAGWPSATASSTSATTAAACTRSGRATGRASGVRAPAAAASGSVRATSTPRRRSPTAASTSATPTGACTRSRRTAASSRGARAPAATSTRRPPSRRCPAGARWSTPAPTAAGSTHWTRAAARCAGSRGGNGKISGGATVIGDIVYYADLGNRRTIGLGARTGRKVFEHERGSYNPVVSDGETIYLTGYHVLYALRPLCATKKARAQVGARPRAAPPHRPPDLHPARARGPPWQAGGEAALDPPLHRAPAGAAPRRGARGMRASGQAGASRAQGRDQPLLPALRQDRRHAHSGASAAPPRRPRRGTP